MSSCLRALEGLAETRRACVGLRSRPLRKGEGLGCLVRLAGEAEMPRAGGNHTTPWRWWTDAGAGGGVGVCLVGHAHPRGCSR